MIVALPIWNGRISPVFDTAGRVRTVEIDGRKRGEAREYLVFESSQEARVEMLCRLGASTLICGAISNRTAALVEQKGIGLMAWISGEIDEVLEAFIDGSLVDGGFLMPGCAGPRRRNRGGCGRGPGGRGKGHGAVGRRNR